MSKNWHNRWALIEDKNADEWGCKNLSLFSPIFSITKNGQKMPLIARFDVSDADLTGEFPFLSLRFFKSEKLANRKSHEDFCKKAAFDPITTYQKVKEDFLFEHNAKFVNFKARVGTTDCYFEEDLFEFLEQSAKYSNGSDFINIEFKINDRGSLSTLNAQIPMENLKESLPLLSEILSKQKIKRLEEKTDENDRIM